MGSGELTDHAQRNRAHWTGLATSYAEAARRAWQREPNWGCWGSPDSELHLLDDVSGKDVLELGCGTAYISSWLARQGARVVGLDVTPAQLETARRMQAEFGIEFELVEASAESIPLPDESFDLVVSEFGASIWCDPYLWVPEAARVLRPGGRLVFLVNGVISMLCYPDKPGPAGTELLRPYFGMHRVEWSFEDSVEFHLPHGDWIRLLRSNGLDVLDLVELQAPKARPTRRSTTPRRSGRGSGRRRRSGSHASALSGRLIAAVVASGATPADSGLGYVIVAKGLRQPVHVTFAPGEPGRLYATERRGTVRVVEDGRVLARAVPRHSTARAIGRPYRPALARFPSSVRNQPPRLCHVHGARRERRRARASRAERPSAPEARHLQRASPVEPLHARGWTACVRSRRPSVRRLGDGLDPAAAQDPANPLGKVLRWTSTHRSGRPRSSRSASATRGDSRSTG